MMLAWTVDLLTISALLGLSALLIEKILRSRHLQSRAPWFVALVASLLLPLIASTMATHAVATGSTKITATELRETAMSSRPPISWVSLAGSSYNINNNRYWARMVIALWIGSTVLGASILALGLMKFRRSQRSWRKGVIAGVPVLVAPETGPAVFGVLRLQIVAPEWLLEAPLETQRYVMAHELSHLQARDPSLLALSVLLVLMTPWNPLLWWQLRRLRMAIEVDCDRRVLRDGAQLQRYAQVLVQFGLRRARWLGAAVSMSETPSTLERRITLMFQPQKTRWTLASVALALLSMGSVAAATRIAPPPLRLAAATALNEPISLESYVGSYEFASVTVLDIRRHGSQLSAAVDQSEDKLSEQGADEFRYQNADVTIHFDRDGAGQVSGVRFEQNGAVTYAPRIAAARVQSIRNLAAERYRQQRATAGSEPALRLLIEGIQSGSPNYATMSPQMVGGTRTMLKSFQETMQPFGPIQSIEFKGVNKAGWDLYRVKHVHGDEDWQIALDDKGIIVGALVHTDT